MYSHKAHTYIKTSSHSCVLWDPAGFHLCHWKFPSCPQRKNPITHIILQPKEWGAKPWQDSIHNSVCVCAKASLWSGSVRFRFAQMLLWQ